MRHLIRLLCAIFLTSCGLSGGISVLRDPVPSGTLIASKTFDTVTAGKEVTGVAMIYESDVNGEYILRLESLVAPSEAGLQVSLTSNGVNDAYFIALRGPRGNQNYSTGLSGVRTFELVKIRPSSQPTVNYGIATF